MNEALKLLIEEALVPVDYAINSCTKNPATCLNLHHKKGSLRAGFDADIVVLDEKYSVVQTFCLGKKMIN